MFRKYKRRYIIRKCHNHEAQTSRGTKRRRDGEQIRSTKQPPYFKVQMDKQRITATEGVGAGLKPVFLARNINLNSDAQITNICLVHKEVSSCLSVKHQSETNIIRNAMMKQSKWLIGDLKPKHKKNTNRTKDKNLLPFSRPSGP